jgi:hypothetical protein
MKQQIFYVIGIFTLFIAIAGCKEDDFVPINPTDEINTNTEQVEGMIVLGKQLDDPYSFKNIKKAYASLMAKGFKADAVNLTPTHLYLRFLPKNEEEWAILKRDSTIALFDYPLNYEIATNGTYYHDPELPDSAITWQYTVIPLNHPIPEVFHEKLYEVFIPPIEEDDSTQKGSLDEFYARLEYESMKLTGNLSGSEAQSGTKDLWPDKWRPKGTLKVNDDYLGEIPLVGAKVHVRFLTHIETDITDDKGYFETTKFRYKVHYSIKWERADFDIRSGNWGQAWYHRDDRHDDVWNFTISKGGMSWVYAHIHRGAHKYYYDNTYGIKSPPKDGKLLKQRIHIGAMDKSGRAHYYDFNKFWLSPQIKVYAKTTSGNWNSSEYIFGTTVHELAHASHWEIGYSYGQYVLDAIFSEPFLPESWALGVESVITSDVYGNTWEQNQRVTLNDILGNGGYTPIVWDMIDNFNQREWYGNSYPVDRVSGYTLPQLENALKNNTSWEAWRNAIRDMYDNPTESYLNELFANYK